MIRTLDTVIVGSYSKPDWLIRSNHMQVNDAEFWRPERAVLADAVESAVRLAVGEQERAGMNVITDGEASRQRFDAHFFARLGGVDPVNLARRERWEIEGRTIERKIDPELDKELANRAQAPRVTGPITWPGPLAVDEVRRLRKLTSKPIKVAIIGPLTSVGRLVDEHYGDERLLGLALADALNKEARALADAGADIIQVDEPSFHSAVSRSSVWGVEALNRVVDGVKAMTAVHICYGYARDQLRKSPSTTYARALDVCASSNVDIISLEYEQPGHTPEILTHTGDKKLMIGLLNLGIHAVEEPEYVADRIRKILTVVPAERVLPSTDCGMWFMPRSVAFAKLWALNAGATIVRNELGV